MQQALLRAAHCTEASARKQSLLNKSMCGIMYKDYIRRETMKKPGNFTSDIHTTDYTSKYEAVRVGHDDLITLDGRALESLNGKWHFHVDPLEYMLRSPWYTEVRRDKAGREIPVDYDFESFEFIDVPSCWNMVRPELFYYDRTCDYIRDFDYVKRAADERVFLHFEGVSYRAYVFLNGEPVALHDGASTPFSVEITANVRSHNHLIVCVDAARRDDRVPMTNTDWFNYGGIYRDVYLVRTGSVVIRNWYVRLVPDGTFSKLEFDVRVDGMDTGSATLTIPDLGVKEDVAIRDGRGTAVFDACPELWSPGNPKLYDVTLTCGGDAVCDKVGFRDFKVEGGELYLNGAPVFLRGISVHEDHIEKGRCTDADTVRETIRLAKKELGCNFIRLAHYPHSRLFAKEADEAGIMLWEEIPVYWAIDFVNEATYRDAENQLGELIMRDRARASVAVWSVGNENPDTDERYKFMSSLAAYAKKTDGTRAVSAACLVNEAEEKIEDRLANNLDIIGINEYYGWYNPDFTKLSRVLANSAPEKPVIITETGAGAKAGNHGDRDTLWTEEYQEEFYKRQIKEIDSCRFIKGMTPWILYDFLTERRYNKWQQGYNRKGLVDADRKTRKLAFAVLASFYKTKQQ